MFNRIKGWHIFFPLVIALGEVAAAIILFNKAFENLDGKNPQALFIVIGSLLTISVVSTFIYFFKFKNTRKQLIQTTEELRIERIQGENYKELFSEINKAYAHIHKLSRTASQDQKEYMRALGDFCTLVATSMAKVTGKKCAVCIKFTSLPSSGDTNGLSVVTLCRDAISQSDRNKGGKKIVHLLKNNFDFNFIFKNIHKDSGRVFKSEDLTQIKGYTNTSFALCDGYDKHDPFPHHMNATEKDRMWPLPYKSCVIAPIRPDADEMEEGKEYNYLKGFLCIDWAEKNAFSDVDVEIIKGCADGLYNAIKNFTEIASK